MSFRPATASVVTLAVVLAAASLVACGNSTDENFDELEAEAGLSASYDVSGEEWLALADSEQVASAKDFIADHPGDCKGGNKDPKLLVQAVALGYEFGTLDISDPAAEIDPSAPVGDVMLEVCKD